MFTGIITCVGKVRQVKKNQSVTEIVIEGTKEFIEGIAVGDSIAVNGVCLTVVTHENAAFLVQMVEATRATTTFSSLREGDAVNLEKALLVAGRIDGHFVQGHVDGVGAITAIKQNKDDYVVTIKPDRELLKYLVAKGSVAIDGVSLTIQSVQQGAMTIAIIPHTYKETILKNKKIGSSVNVETDILGKYIVSLSAFDKKQPSSVSLSTLLKNGF